MDINFGFLCLIFILTMPVTFAIGVWLGIDHMNKLFSKTRHKIYEKGVLDVVQWFKNKDNQNYVNECMAPYYGSTQELVERLGTEIEIQFNVKVEDER